MNIHSALLLNEQHIPHVGSVISDCAKPIKRYQAITWACAVKNPLALAVVLSQSLGLQCTSKNFDMNNPNALLHLLPLPIFMCSLVALSFHTHTHTCSLSFRWYYSLYLACPACPPLLHVLPLSLGTSLPSCFFTSLSGYLFPSVATLFSLPLPSHMLSQACLSLPFIFYLTVCDLSSSLPTSLPPSRFPSIDIPFCSSPFVPSLVCNIFHSFSHPVSASRLPRMFIHFWCSDVWPPSLLCSLTTLSHPLSLCRYLLFSCLSHALSSPTVRGQASTKTNDDPVVLTKA